MAYFVYENWRARGHKAIVHRGTCHFCNDGRGVTTGTRSDNGRWHGPYSTAEQAFDRASATGGRVGTCRCVPTRTSAARLGVGSPDCE